MDARQSRRKIVNIQANLVFEGKRYASFIENLSEDGVYAVTAPTDTSLAFEPEKLIDLNFELPSGDKLSLNCRIKWSFKTPPHGLTDSIGMEIIDPPQTYKDAISTL